MRKKTTANAAFQAVVDRKKRRQFADWLKSGGLPDLTGPIEPAEAEPSNRSGCPVSRSKCVVDVATVAEVDHEDDQFTIADDIDDAVVADSDAQ